MPEVTEPVMTRVMTSKSAIAAPSSPFSLSLEMLREKYDWFSLMTSV